MDTFPRCTYVIGTKGRCWGGPGHAGPHRFLCIEEPTWVLWELLTRIRPDILPGDQPALARVFLDELEQRRREAVTVGGLQEEGRAVEEIASLKKGRRRTHEEIIQAWDDHMKGESTVEIARRLGCSASALYYRWKDAGFDIQKSREERPLRERRQEQRILKGMFPALFEGSKP